MPKARIKVQPTGLINGAPWPEVGEYIDLPANVIDDLVASGVVEKHTADKPKAEKPKVEKRPAVKSPKVETRKK